MLDVEVDVLRLSADVDDTRADLGQGEARAINNAVVTRTFDATDVEATTRTADGGVTGEGQITDTRRGIKCRRAGVDEHPEAANASANEVQVDVAGTKDTRSEILAVQVERGAIGYRDERAFREGLLRIELHRTLIDVQATREAVITTEEERAEARLDEGDCTAQAFLDAGAKGVGVREDAAETDRHGRSPRTRVDELRAVGTREGTLGQVVAIEVEEARGERQGAGVRTEGRSGGRGVRAEANRAAVNDGRTRVGVGTREDEDAHAGLLNVTFTEDGVGEGDGVDRIDRQGRAQRDGDVARDRPDFGAITELERTTLHQRGTREGDRADVRVARGARVGVGAREGDGTRAGLAEGNLTRQAVIVIHNRPAVDTAQIGNRATEGQERRRGVRVIDHRTEDMRRGREERADDFTLTRHVEHAAIEVKGTAVIDLVGPRTREAHDTARINVRSATEGVRARTGLQAEHDRAIIHHQRKGVVIQRAREGQRARAILGQRRDAAGDTIQGDVARAANAEAGGALGQHAGDGRRGRAAIDKRAHAVDARAGDGEAFADGLTVEVERGPRVDGRRARRRTEGVRVVEAEDATVNGGRTRIGIRGGEDDRTGGTGGADGHGIGAAQVSLDRQRRTAAAEAVTGSTGSERSTGRAEDRWHRGTEHQGRDRREAKGGGGIAGQGERAGRAGRQLTGGQPGRGIGIGAGSVQGTGRTNRDGGRGDGRRALNFQEAGTDRGVARVGVRTREDDLTSQEHVGRWTRAAGESTDGHGIRASEHRRDGQRGAATAEEEAAGTRREGTRVGAVRSRTEAQRVVAGKVDRGVGITRQSE